MLSIIGKIGIPDPLTKFAGGDIQAGALGIFLNLIIKALIIAAGVYSLFNLVLAGYAFMSAGDDPKKMAAAWGKIWQTILGLAFTAGAFVLAAIFGLLLFGDTSFLLMPRIQTP